MIIVRFTSGLGNQLFQYNLYSLLREKFPQTRVLADVNWFARFSEHQGFELERLFKREDNPEFAFERASDWDIIRCSGRIPNRIPGRAGDIWQYILRVPHRFLKLNAVKYASGRIDQTGFEDNREIYDRLMAIDPEKDYYITGFFIEEVYYRDRLKKLQEQLVFSPLTGKNADYEAMIREGYSVSLHVRRGDYLSPKYSGSFIALSQDYYKRAVEGVYENNKNARFFIFSDDPDYVRENFGFVENAVYVRGNTGRDSYRDLQLMSLCRENITANSTFSTWAGLLNKNKDARVYYPREYMREKDSEIKTMEGWIRL